MRAARPFLVVLVSLAVLAGCEEGGTDGSAATTRSVATSTTGGATTSTVATSTLPQDPGKAAQAAAAVLQPGDLPEGWRAKPDDERLDHETTWRDLTRCLGSEDSGQGVGRALSPSYARGPAPQVTSAVEYLPAATVSALTAAFSGPKVSTCAQEAFSADVKRNAPEGATPGPIQVAPLEVPKLGQLTAAFRASTTLEMGIQMRLIQDFVIVFEGESVSRVSFLGAGSPFDAQLRDSLVGKVVGRA